MKKNLLKMAACLAVMVLSLGFYSCGEDEEGKGSVAELIGTWEGVSSDEWWIENGKKTEEKGKDISDERYEFREDMTFNLYDKSKNGTWHVSETGKWKFSDGSLKLYYYYEEEDILDDDPDVLKVLEISVSNLVLEYYWKNGDEEDYMKANFRKVK